MSASPFEALGGERHRHGGGLVHEHPHEGPHSHAHAVEGQAESPEAAEAIDPVCGMTVEIATARHKTEYAGQTYYFCAPGCKRSFEKDPEKYLAATAYEEM